MPANHCFSQSCTRTFLFFWDVRMQLPNQLLMIEVIVLYFFLSDMESLAYVTSAAVQCNRRCTRKKLECSTKCRTEGYAIYKPRVLGCLRDCKGKYQRCDRKCSCLGMCTRERKGCDESCRDHPFQNQDDRHECFEECIHDSDECFDLCFDGKLTLPLWNNF